MRRDFSWYIADQWNLVDLLGLGLLAGGLIVRYTNETSSLGRTLYALSAPLVFSRVLFFAQMLRFQGPMIQASVGHGTINNVFSLRQHQMSEFVGFANAGLFGDFTVLVYGRNARRLIW